MCRMGEAPFGTLFITFYIKLLDVDKEERFGAAVAGQRFADFRTWLYLTLCPKMLCGVWITSSMSMGLERKPFMPASIAAFRSSSKALAVIARMGMPDGHRAAGGGELDGVGQQILLGRSPL